MELSNRLKAVAGLVSAGNTVCDVGCDHGYVPIYLIQNGICGRVIAMDVNAGPLARAREHIESAALGEYIEIRQSDGVAALGYEEAKSLILAGMGGRLTMRILTEGMEKVQALEELILQPQSDVEAVRVFLRDIGFEIVQEDMVYEDGKYYPMMRACPVSGERHGVGTEMVQQQAVDRYGPYLLAHRHPVLYAYLRWEQEREEAIREGILAHAGQMRSANCSRLAELDASERIRKYALTCFAN